MDATGAAHSSAKRSRPQTATVKLSLAVAAIGVVFGDIGTSPLYTIKTCLGLAGAKGTLDDVLGICSLLFWTLAVVVCGKYCTFIMRVDHGGEGGILALFARATPPRAFGAMVPLTALTVLVIVGSSMLLGDGIITPAISVISAIEGLGIVSSAFTPYIVPISLIVLVALFAVQRGGAEKVGRVFGPVMIVWFGAIAFLGARAILVHPEVLRALDPRYAVHFATRGGLGSLVVFGGVVLAITGVEALYADLSHFGRRPIVTAWYALVFPALLLCYFGQGAALLYDPRALENPFFALAPAWGVLPLVVLATVATVIASQALISGTFTLVEQAIALNLAPRVHVQHTSHRYKGQVFVPSVNRWLLVGCAVLIVGFRSSDRLAAAYGLAVCCTMMATSLTYYAVVRNVLRWNRFVAAAVVVVFLVVDGGLIVACLPKVLDGGWIPLGISAVLTAVGLTWFEGRRALGRALAAQQTPFEDVIEQLPPGIGQQGTMVFLTPDPSGVPFLARHRWIRERAHDERIVVMNIARAATPYCEPLERVTVERFSLRLVRVVARFGYMEAPRMSDVFSSCRAFGLDLDRDDTSFFYADPKIEAAPHGMSSWRRDLFTALQRNARPLPDDLRIKAERRVELGVTVTL